MLLFNTHSAHSIRDSVELFLSFRKSRAFLIAINPSSYGILRHRPTTSIVHSMISSGKGGKLTSLHKKSFVSLTYDLTF